MKLGAIGALSAGVSAHAASLVEALQERPLSQSPSMKTTYDLSQLSWKLIGLSPFYSNFAQTHDDASFAVPDAGPLTVSIPVSVQAALLKAGIIEDWNVGLNARKCEWLENRDWIYEVAIPDEWLQNGQQVRVRCAGLDYAGDIVLNKTTVASFRNSFVPVVADLTSALKPSGNVLSIRLTPGPRWLGQVGYTSRMNEWKPRFYFGWDWVNRIVQTAIWDTVTLEITHGAEIKTLRCFSDVDLASGKGKLKVWGSVHGGSKVRITLTDRARELRTVEVNAPDFSSSGLQWNELPVDLWWPNRMGPQSLYNLEVELLDDHGRLLERQSRRVGFKSIEWRRTKGAPDTADPYLCVVNGKAVFLFGVNWTPIRPNFADVREEDYRKRANIYRDCGMNLVRVWGGAVLEKENFYNLCDELGLLVWQEFPLSSSGLDNYPPDDPASVDELGKIAQSYIERRAHHVSLLLWCGGNELQDDKNGVKSNQPTLTIRNHPAVVRMAEVVAREDSGRRFLATNPYGPVGVFSLQDCGKGVFWDVHGPWNLDGLPEGEWTTLWARDDAMFHSEMGAPSTSPVSIIRKYKGDLPEVPGTSENPLWARQSWWIDWPKFAKEKGREPRDLEEFVAWMNARQEAALTIALRSVLSRFPACGGLIIWMGHDSFPCTENASIVDFDGNPKPVVAELAKLLS
ncbi:glycoside hydrolase family 2 TIM barrel-domain containing protein [Tunturiibacter empetritectus]|uniref:beta-mannosidase n=2 Tax=Tunturiibacter TaxID=3154218 RepID=A0A852VQD6_9BACT|nr:glycoside hydrolase family 2 TIM barrel-domain containing protein [Edaphobacter lichenicola]NYF92265.1 beta-mannosidase [Edaphobacter lichenicola]